MECMNGLNSDDGRMWMHELMSNVNRICAHRAEVVGTSGGANSMRWEAWQPPRLACVRFLIEDRDDMKDLTICNRNVLRNSAAPSVSRVSQ